MKIIRITFFVLLIFCFSSSKLITQSKDPLVVTFGFSSKIFEEVNIHDAKATIKIWAENLISRIAQNQRRDFKVNVTIYQSIDQIINDVNKDNVDIIVLQSLDYFQIRKNNNVSPLVFTTSSKSEFETKILFVRKNSTIYNINDLAEKKLSIAKGGLSAISRLWVDNLLNKDNKNRIKLDLIEMDNIPKSVLAVYLSKIDACVVDKSNFEAMCELNPRLKSDLRIIAESYKFPLGITCVRKNYKEFTKEKLLDISMNLKNDAQGRQVLKIFKITGLVPFDDSSLSGLEQMMAETRKK